MIKVRFGADSVDLASTTPITVQAFFTGALGRRAKAALGYGDNVRYVRDGFELAGSDVLNSGETVTVETKANSKA